MTRNTAIVFGLIGCSVVLGWLRGRAIAKAYFRISTDLKKEGIELSQAELRVLIDQLRRNPKAVLDTDSNSVSRNIKEQHVQELISFVKPIGYGYWIIGIVAIASLILWRKH